MNDMPSQPDIVWDAGPSFGRSDGEIEGARCSDCGQSPCECKPCAQCGAEKGKCECEDGAGEWKETTLAALGAQLNSKLQDCERKRQYIEDRWLEDLRQYHGRYDPQVEGDLNEAESCALFLNITRPKTNAYAARVIDMVLPTDEKNFGLSETAVPEIVEVHQTAEDEQATETGPDGQPVPVSTPEGSQVLNKDIIKGVKDEAKNRAEKMEEEIDDQLAECNYNGLTRKAIDQMSKLGTAVLLGPVITDEWKVEWQAVPEVDEQGQKTGKTNYQRALVANKDKRPGVQWVDCWNFYPDMTGNAPDEWEFFFVQALVNRGTLKKFAKRFNFIPGKVKEVLETSPFSINTLRWMLELRNLSESNNFVDDRYRLMRYFGELSDDDLRAVGKDPEKMGLEPGQTIRGQVWFCNSIVLRVDLNPLDSQDLPISIAYCDKDEASPFGIGIPRAMRGEQESINSSWRMIHDNGGLSTGPQTVMRANAITPADGDYHLKPKKMWFAANDATRVQDVFHQFSIDSHQEELSNILQLAIRFADDVTQLPLLMQGDQAPHITQTAQGMSLLYNASTVVLRRTVKMFDDWVTVPMITRFYEWNMQFNPRDDIKGDMRCEARGSSTLLDKEQQGQALDMAMQLAMQPTWQPYTDMKKLYQQALKAKRIQDIVLSDEEIKANLQKQEQAAAAQAQAGAGAQKAGPDPAVEQAKLAVLQRANDLKAQEIESKERLAVMKMATDEKISVAEAEARFAGIKVKVDNDNMQKSREMQLKSQMGTGI